MIVVHLDDDIVFGTLLPPPALSLLMFVSNKKMRDVNRLKDGKLMIGWPELQKRADRSDQSVLIFPASANFWAIHNLYKSAFWQWCYTHIFNSKNHLVLKLGDQVI